jgi:hypothetical protein
MRKVIITAWFFSLALSIASVVSFSDTIVVKHEGDIAGMVFSFGNDGLLIEDLPGIPEITVRFAQVEASGKERITITSSGRYSYKAKLGEGFIYAWERVPKLDENGVPKLKPNGEFLSKPTLQVPIESATSNEHFTIPDFDPDDPDFDPNYVEIPPDVDLYFTAALAPGEGVIVDFKLRVKHGQVVFP